MVVHWKKTDFEVNQECDYPDQYGKYSFPLHVSLCWTKPSSDFRMLLNVRENEFVQI